MTLPQRPRTRARVLVVEDSSVFREMQALLLRQAGFGVWSFESPAAALAEAAGQCFELALVDYELPGMNGEEFMHALRQLQPDIPVIFVSGSLTLKLVGKLSRAGAAGIFSKPANPKILLDKVHEALNRAARESELRAGADLQSGVSNLPFPLPEPSPDRLAYEPRYVYGASDAFRQFTHRLWRVRDFRSVLLLQGERGSPFELIAQEIVGLSIFRTGPVMICEPGEFEPQRLSEILAPSLLTPQAGTLIVHGLDEFSRKQQALLAELLGLGGMFQPFARRFRLVIAATSQLAARVESRVFEEELYYKLSALSLSIPTLAEMRGDIAVNGVRLLEHFHSTSETSATTTLSAEAATWLEVQPWPGNYDQLAHTLFFALRHATGGQVDLAALQAAALDYDAVQHSQSAQSSASSLPTPSIEIAIEGTESNPASAETTAANTAAISPAAS